MIGSKTVHGTFLNPKNGTNRPGIPNPAFLRTEGFDRHVLVGRLNRVGRFAILKVDTKTIKVAPDVECGRIATVSTGFSGIDPANPVDEAALLTARRRAECCAMEDFTCAIERMVAGLEKRNRVLNARAQNRRLSRNGPCADHQGLPGLDGVHKVPITQRGIGALDCTIQCRTEDRFLITREELENKTPVLLGGSAAENLIFGSLSTGASNWRFGRFGQGG